MGVGNEINYLKGFQDLLRYKHELFMDRTLGCLGENSNGEKKLYKESILIPILLGTYALMFQNLKDFLSDC